MKYFFILGKNPILSKAEIEAVLEFKVIKYKVIKFRDKILILELENELDIEWLNSRLGGTVKIGKILDSIDNLEEFEDKFFKQVKFGSGKVFFGFSLYSLSPEIHIAKLQKKINAMAMNIKARLRDEHHVNSRYVVSREVELSSVIVKKNKLLQNGAEICFFIKSDEILFGQTLAVQPFEEFGARDFARPGRDQLSGMLPPKLALMMINLAQIKPEAVILDPFCGSGTILQEALLLGYGNLIGTDNSEKAVSDSLRNLDWLIKKYEIENKKYEILKLDVKNLSKKFGINSVDALISEPYLGPP